MSILETKILRLQVALHIGFYCNLSIFSQSRKIKLGQPSFTFKFFYTKMSFERRWRVNPRWILRGLNKVTPTSLSITISDKSLQWMCLAFSYQVDMSHLACDWLLFIFNILHCIVLFVWQDESFEQESLQLTLVKLTIENRACLNDELVHQVQLLCPMASHLGPLIIQILTDKNLRFLVR